jgi:hypothetical protein
MTTQDVINSLVSKEKDKEKKVEEVKKENLHLEETVTVKKTPAPAQSQTQTIPPPPQQQPQQPTQEPLQQDEWHLSEELLKKRSPRIYNMEKSKRLVVKSKDPNVEIYDYFLYDALEGKNVIWTVVFIIMYPLSQLRPYTQSTPIKECKDFAKLKYQILEGIGQVSTSDLFKIIKKGDFFVVEEGIKHNIINNREESNLVLTMEYPGHLDARDLYLPVSQQKKKADESREALYKLRPEQQQQQPQQQQPASSSAGKFI